MRRTRARLAGLRLRLFGPRTEPSPSPSESRYPSRSRRPARHRIRACRTSSFSEPAAPFGAGPSQDRLEGLGNESSSLSICWRNGDPEFTGPHLRNPRDRFAGDAKLPMFWSTEMKSRATLIENPHLPRVALGPWGSLVYPWWFGTTRLRFKSGRTHSSSSGSSAIRCAVSDRARATVSEHR